MPSFVAPPLDEFLRQRAADRRLARLTHDIALPAAHGLEFGPGANPTPLPDGFTVEYVDHALDPGLQPGAVAIDHVWSGAGSLARVLGRADYDFAIAAQVAQYVPNLLGWFRGIHAVLRPGGVLNLSLPDRRFMFDIGRHTSTMAELIEADWLDYDRPSPRQIFAHTFEARAVETAEIWAGRAPAEGARLPRFCGTHALELARDETAAALAEGRYVPCHCWVFTPLSFLEVIEQATRLEVFPFVISQFAATDPGGFEFFVSLRRDAEDEPAALLAMQLGAIAHVRAIAEKRELMAELLGRG